MNRSFQLSDKFKFTLFNILFVLLFFHKLRDATSLYLLILSLIFIFTFLVNFKHPIYVINKYFILYILFILYLFYLAYISIFTISTNELISTWPRLILTPIFGFISPLFINTQVKLRKLIGLYIFLSVFFCLSLYFQMIIGPISWFADSASRGGLTRFSSLYGNVTAIGISGSLALIVLINFRMNFFLKFFSSLIIVSSLLLSLQKAAIMGIVVIVLIGLINNFKIKYFFYFILFFILTYILLLMSPPLIKDYVNVSLVNTFGFTPFANDVEVYSLSTETELKGRFLEHPTEVFDVVGFKGILFGGGILGGGGAFGIESAQAHNSFFDLLFSGGILFLSLFIYILYHLIKFYKNQLKLTNSLARENSKVIFNFLLLFLIHMPFNSGGVFHPNHSILFWVSFGIITSNLFLKKNNTNINENVKL